MSLQSCLIDLERFMSKEWRIHAKDDPLSSLSFNEFDYLKVIQFSPEPIRITDLATEMMVTKPSASNMVVRLERKKLVQRVPCPNDARATRIMLTDKAIKDLSMEDKVHQIITRKLESKASEQESEQLVAILTKMLK
jgi:DNA-binding MarR family transcriptional regulator